MRTHRSATLLLLPGSLHSVFCSGKDEREACTIYLPITGGDMRAVNKLAQYVERYPFPSLVGASDHCVLENPAWIRNDLNPGIRLGLT